MIRDYILVYINGKRYEVRDRFAFTPLANFLREELGLTGTKIVCAEGDCGACTILKGSLKDKELVYQSINSCIVPMVLLDRSHILTVEALKKDGRPNELQKAMIENNGAQCGYCTPGFMMAMSELLETNEEYTEKKVKNCLTGNLCRCTGYDPIIKACTSVNTKNYEKLSERYSDPDLLKDLKDHEKVSVELHGPDHSYYAPKTLKEALALKAKLKDVTIFSAATDLGVQINKRGSHFQNYLSLHLIDELKQLKTTKNEIKVGALATLTELQKFLEGKQDDFAELLNIFASPQIKNIGTLVGNVANGSPIGDTIPFLFVTEAMINLQSASNSRSIEISKFYKGYKDFNLKKGEIITSITIPKTTSKIRLYKVSQRKDLDISAVTAGFSLELSKDKKVSKMHMAFGGVGPVVKRIKSAEKFIKGKELSEDNLNKMSDFIKDEITPISDVRGSSKFRTLLATNLLRKFHHELEKGGLL